MFLIILFLSACLYINAGSIPQAFKSIEPIFEIQDRLLRIYFLGEGHLLHVWEKRYFSSLYILHLLTPSGLHLTSLMVPLRYLLRRVFKKKTTIYWAKILIILPFCFFENFHSLRRVAIFFILMSLNNSPTNSSQVSQKCFWITFFIDFLNGSYFASPLSFTYSFLFWGSIITHLQNKKIMIIKSLICSQLLLSIIDGSSFNFFGFIVGQIITAIYCLIFPFLIALEPLRYIFKIKASLLQPIHSSLYFIGKNSSYLPEVTIPLLILIFFIFSKKSIRVITVLLFSFDCTNQIEPFKAKPKHYLGNGFLENKEIKQVARSKKKIYITTKTHELCQAKLKNDYWDMRCKEIDKLKRNAEP